MGQIAVRAPDREFDQAPLVRFEIEVFVEQRVVEPAAVRFHGITDEAFAADLDAVLRFGGAGREQVLQFDLPTRLRKQHAAFDQVFQFAHVAGPVLREQRLHRAVGDAVDLLVVGRGVFLDQGRGQQGDVGLALA